MDRRAPSATSKQGIHHLIIMNKGNFSTLSRNATIQRRLAAYSALAAGACAVSTAPGAKAAVVTSGPLNITVPANSNGIYLNLVTGATATTATGFAGYDFNPYSNGTTAAPTFATYFSGSATAGNAGLVVNGAYAVLTIGSVVGPASTFTTGSTATLEANYRAGVADGYFGIHFLNESTNALNYGYVELKTTGTGGFPATILSYGYDNTGAAITIPNAVPEPTTNVALGLGALALGAVGVRRMRQRRQAAA